MNKYIIEYATEEQLEDYEDFPTLEFIEDTPKELYGIKDLIYIMPESEYIH